MKLQNAASIIALSLVALTMLSGCKREHTHSFGQWETLKEPSCIEAGEMKRSCECGEAETESISAKGHSYVDNICTECGDSFFSEGLEFASNGDGTCYVKGIGSCQDLEINIPEKSPSGERVVAIGELAFSMCFDITGVTIPDGVTSIGTKAFEACLSAVEISVPDSVESIGVGAFLDCKLLRNINIPEGVSRIANGTFQGCNNLTCVTIPSSVSIIGEWAFLGCESLVEIVNKSSLDITEKGYFQYGEGGYSQETNLGRHALNIIKDEAESRLRVQGDFVFYDDGESALLVRYLGNDRDVTLPEYDGGRGYKIHNFAFYNNHSVSSVVIPEGVTEIGNGAFESCYSLTNVVVPSTVTSIIPGAFIATSSLVEIVNKSSLEIDFADVVTDESSSGISRVGDYVFYEKDGEAYLVKYLGNEANVVLPEYKGGRAYKVRENAFLNAVFGYNRLVLQSIEFPDYVVGIENCAFYNATMLENIVIGDGICSLGTAFVNCVRIKHITLGKNVAEFDAKFLYHGLGNSALMSITVDGENPYFKSVDGHLYSKDGKVLVRYAGGCGETVVVIPEGVTTIGKYAFADCDSIKKMVVTEGVTDIKDYAFRGCGGLEKVVLPRSLKAVGKEAFGGMLFMDENGTPHSLIYYAGTREEYQQLRKDNSKYTTGLPTLANYNYTEE